MINAVQKHYFYLVSHTSKKAVLPVISRGLHRKGIFEASLNVRNEYNQVMEKQDAGIYINPLPLLIKLN